MILKRDMSYRDIGAVAVTKITFTAFVSLKCNAKKLATCKRVGRGKHRLITKWKSVGNIWKFHKRDQ